METHVGGNSFEQDRPATRMRIVLRPDDAKQPRRIFPWILKIVFALAAGVLCVAIASYAPVGGPPIAAYIPANCTLLVQSPSGAALHRALLENPAFNELIDDPDTLALFESLSKNQPRLSAENENADPSTLPIRTLRTEFDLQHAKLPWPVSTLVPSTASGFYPLIGGESAIALERIEDPASTGAKPGKKNAAGVLIFLRLSGSRGHLARLAFAFYHGSKNAEVFDLGGGLIAVGINGARPAFEPHAPPMVVSAYSENLNAQEKSLLRISFSPKSVPVQATPPNQPLDLNNETVARLFEEDVPESVLRALLKPPGAGDMLNWKTPPAVARIDFFASTGGNFTAHGRIDGEVPPLPGAHANAGHESKRASAFADFAPGGPMAEFVLPIDLRACFLRYVESSMKLVKDAEGLTKGQRLWMGRFHVLADDQVNLDASFWPAIGHVAMLEVHEAKKDEDATPMGTIKAWLPCDVKNPETFFAAADLARARWDYVFDSNDRVTVKSQFVKRFRAETEDANSQGDRYVLATGKINAPAWSISSKGFRITTDAGAFALIRGPQESDFITPPAELDAYRIRLDGPRMASTVESLVTLYYDDLEYDIGAQKFLLLHGDNKLIIRLSNKWSKSDGKISRRSRPRCDWRSTESGLEAGENVRFASV